MMFLLTLAPDAGQQLSPIQKFFGGGMGQLTPILLVMAAFYFFMIAPQSKKQREHETWQKRVAVGDEIVTTGGLVGKVTHATEDLLTVEVGDKVRVRVLRSHATGPAPGAKSDKDGKSDKKASA